eukprot:CAMPEP_0181228722 /NCGR_PEP_ID=MMETSP1096-20121128/33502_1 /TAXON_ID=156174 ORGANISM="Chrysochromulina ericina, Strain CCMP281" /NCGR_SAMPLE_ID=MMETSP1096 /ASSEMBLY_ACC=CAM_ASM_000453 /LENGTH=157 /DNA_ID=CAMNT_0023322271 /DNA_START=331 /DNA_END=801 /DNA_ORIENTATION=+
MDADSPTSPPRASLALTPGSTPLSDADASSSCKHCRNRVLCLSSASFSLKSCSRDASNKLSSSPADPSPPTSAPRSGKFSQMTFPSKDRMSSGVQPRLICGHWLHGVVGLVCGARSGGCALGRRSALGASRVEFTRCFYPHAGRGVEPEHFVRARGL